MLQTQCRDDGVMIQMWNLSTLLAIKIYITSKALYIRIRKIRYKKA
jgi:hypothetical protein